MTWQCYPALTMAAFDQKEPIEMALVDTILFCVSIYLGAGVLISILFVLFGISRIDAAAKGASFFFRPVIFLGCVLLWPYIVVRFASMKQINLPVGDEE